MEEVANSMETEYKEDPEEVIPVSTTTTAVRHVPPRIDPDQYQVDCPELIRRPTSHPPQGPNGSASLFYHLEFYETCSNLSSSILTVMKERTSSALSAFFPRLQRIPKQ